MYLGQTINYRLPGRTETIDGEIVEINEWTRTVHARRSGSTEVDALSFEKLKMREDDERANEIAAGTGICVVTTSGSPIFGRYVEARPDAESGLKVDVPHGQLATDERRVISLSARDVVAVYVKEENW